MTERTLLGLADDVEAGHGGACPASGLQERRQDPDRRRLAGAVRPEQAQDGALRDLEVDAVERADLALARAVDLDQAFGGNRSRDDDLLGGRLARRSGRPGVGQRTRYRNRAAIGNPPAAGRPGRRPHDDRVRHVALALVLHNHQPVGNFGWVIADAYEHAYEPLIAALERHPRVRLALHYSGPLLDWLQAERPEFLERVGRLVAAGRVELLGGAYYEPILAALPQRDRAASSC